MVLRILILQITLIMLSVTAIAQSEQFVTIKYINTFKRVREPEHYPKFSYVYMNDTLPISRVKYEDCYLHHSIIITGKDSLLSHCYKIPVIDSLIAKKRVFFTLLIEEKKHYYIYFPQASDLYNRTFYEIKIHRYSRLRRKFYYFGGEPGLVWTTGPIKRIKKKR